MSQNMLTNTVLSPEDMRDPYVSQEVYLSRGALLPFFAERGSKIREVVLFEGATLSKVCSLVTLSQTN